MAITDLSPISVVLCSSVSFCSVFYYFAGVLKLTLLKNQNRASIFEVSNKIVSALHAIIVVAVNIVVVNATQYDLVHARHKWTNFCVYFSVGYNFYDLYAMYFVFVEKNGSKFVDMSEFRKIRTFIANRTAMVFHHLLFVIGAPIFNWLRTGRGDFVIGCLNLMEMSTPFVSFRAILSELNMKNTTLYKVNGILMIVVFFICRILFFPFVFFRYSQYASISFFHTFFNIPYKCIVGCSILLSLQFYWFSLMFFGALKFFNGSPKSSAVKIE